MSAIDLNMTTTERLRMVASLVETTPEKWDQYHWDEDDRSPAESIGAGMCGTACCVAGWAVRLSPETLFGPYDIYGWVRAGAKAFGLTEETAEELFLTDRHGTWDDPQAMAAELRRLADLPEGER